MKQQNRLNYKNTNTKNDNRIVQSYLFFGGRCEEALEFYCNALGAQADLVHYKESPEPPPPGVLC
jgi:PhnB protein